MEGEHIPVRMERLEFLYPPHLELLLPVVIEHTIDERSPLFGHTHESLTVTASLSLMGDTDQEVIQAGKTADL